MRVDPVRVTMIGGGSRQWGPKLVTDLLITPSLAEVDLVLHDTDASTLPPVQRYAEMLIDQLGIGATVRTTTDRGEALDGADFVGVCISTGGFASMTHDLAIPERHGIRQTVGDSVGPGGISRALRNIPVMLDIARDMEGRCPDAWLLNLTNPMTTLTRSVTRETSIRAVGLCHEVVIMSWFVAIACGVDASEIEMGVTGVNHLPWICELTIAGEDGFAALRRAMSERPDAAFFAEEHAWNLALLDRYGVLPGAGDRHTIEFFPWGLSETTGWGKAWGIELTSIADRERHEAEYRADLAAIVAGEKRLPTWPSGEMLAPIIDSITTGTRRELPLNIPNTGQAPYLPLDAVVETMCFVDGDGVRGRDALVPPAPCAEWVRRHVAVQEMTVEAAVTGDAGLAKAAMLLDPLAGRGDGRDIEAMVDELLAATSAWLPQFAGSS